MKTYEERVKLLKTALDIDKQVASAEREARRYRRQSKADISFAEKIELNNKSKACREVANRLRINYFALMDSLELVYPTTNSARLKNA